MSVRGVVIGAAGAVLLLAGAYTAGRASVQAVHRAEVAALREDLAQRVAQAGAKAREIEQRAAQDVASIEAKHHAEIEAARTDLARLDADLRAGTVRLRDRFTCATAGASGGAPEAATSTGQRHAATQGGLSREDAEFLVRFAGEADAVTRQLAACQAIVRSDRGGE